MTPSSNEDQRVADEVFIANEIFEPEYKLQNRIRITTNVESFTTEVYTGLRWIPVSEYVVAVLEANTKRILDKVEEYIICADEIEEGGYMAPVKNQLRHGQRSALTQIRNEELGSEIKPKEEK